MICLCLDARCQLFAHSPPNSSLHLAAATTHCCAGAALAQVGAEFTMQIDTGFTPFSPPKSAPRAALNTDGESPADVLATVVGALGSTTVTLSEAVVAALVCVHRAAIALAARLGRVTGRPHYLSPRDYLDLIKKFVDIEGEKRGTLEEQQTHIRTGLQKLLETQDKVADLRGEMASKDAVLKVRNAPLLCRLSRPLSRPLPSLYLAPI